MLLEQLVGSEVLEVVVRVLDDDVGEAEGAADLLDRRHARGRLLLALRRRRCGSRGRGMARRLPRRGFPALAVRRVVAVLTGQVSVLAAADAHATEVAFLRARDGCDYFSFRLCYQFFFRLVSTTFCLFRGI